MIFFLKKENRIELLNIYRLHNLGYKLCTNLEDLTLLQYNTLLYASEIAREEDKKEADKEKEKQANNNSDGPSLADRQKEFGIVKNSNGRVVHNE